MHNFCMTKEITLSEQHKASLLLHHLDAKRDEQLLRWLDEVIQNKVSSIEATKAKIETMRLTISSLEKEIEAVQKHKQGLIADTKVNLENILKKIVTDVGIGPNSKAQLLFDGNEPKIVTHE